MELSKGTTLQGGKYNIERVLGRGSFGITYLANTTIPMDGSRDGLEIETEVAVKEFFMSDLNSRSSNGVNVEQTAAPLVKSYRERFRKEAQTLRNLHHEHIVRVLDVFDENNTTYFVMEYIEGVSVNEYIRSQKHLSEVEAVRIVQEIGAALEYMHNHQMLHLDLKPGNMMRRNDGKAILIDFGLSKVFDDNGKPETSTTIGNGTPPTVQANNMITKNLVRFLLLLTYMLWGLFYIRCCAAKRLLMLRRCLIMDCLLSHFKAMA